MHHLSEQCGWPARSEADCRVKPSLAFPSECKCHTGSVSRRKRCVTSGWPAAGRGCAGQLSGTVDPVARRRRHRDLPRAVAPPRGGPLPQRVEGERQCYLSAAVELRRTNCVIVLANRPGFGSAANSGRTRLISSTTCCRSRPPSRRPTGVAGAHPGRHRWRGRQASWCGGVRTTLSVNPDCAEPFPVRPRLGWISPAPGSMPGGILPHAISVPANPAAP
jgi:hypothetical protein